MTAEPDWHGGDFAALSARLQAFALTRDWLRNHNPKNLGVSLAIEVGELLEHFQWLNDDQASEVKRQPEKMAHVRSELADVLIYLMYLASALDVDLLAAAQEKMDVNERRFAPKARE
ncbi:MAG TPA: nucleotide pyrophosphohydrolase [Trebonia sp.]|nr:nucleotide pyrophosphohydrolase [Trebonia sp.]